MSGEPLSRREFLEQTQSAALVLPVLAKVRTPTDLPRVLERVATRLLATWGEGLLSLQVRAPSGPAFRGGLLCPACARIHGREGEAVYPFLRLFRSTGDSRFLDAARDVFGWTANVSREDGSWSADSSS